MCVLGAGFWVALSAKVGDRGIRPRRVQDWALQRLPMLPPGEWIIRQERLGVAVAFSKLSEDMIEEWARTNSAFRDDGYALRGGIIPLLNFPDEQVAPYMISEFSPDSYGLFVDEIDVVLIYEPAQNIAIACISVPSRKK